MMMIGTGFFLLEGLESAENRLEEMLQLRRNLANVDFPKYRQNRLKGLTKWKGYGVMMTQKMQHRGRVIVMAHQKVDEVVLSSEFVLNKSDKSSGENERIFVIKFFHEGHGGADVILGIRIKREDKGITITQSHYIEKILKKFKCDDCCPVITPLDLTIKLMPNTGRAVDQLEYSRAIGYLMYAITSTRPDIAYAMGKLSKYTSNPSTHRWHAIIRASKKQTYITDSTMEAEFVALAAAGKEAEWLRNLIYEIPLWAKPISPIFIHCDSAATLAKAYCQIYNGKSRHLGVRHSMVCELIINGVIFVDFVRSQQNMSDHLTKGLARDLVHKSAIVMGLKSIKISNDETPNSLLTNARSRIQCGKLIFSDWSTFNTIIPKYVLGSAN
ncbi:hypothetical protein Tco_0957485 [Tanacetum coccineum]